MILLRGCRSSYQAPEHCRLRSALSRITPLLRLDLVPWAGHHYYRCGCHFPPCDSPLASLRRGPAVRRSGIFTSSRRLYGGHGRGRTLALDSDPDADCEAWYPLATLYRCRQSSSAVRYWRLLGRQLTGFMDLLSRTLSTGVAYPTDFGRFGGRSCYPGPGACDSSTVQNLIQGRDIPVRFVASKILFQAWLFRCTSGDVPIENQRRGFLGLPLL